MIKNYFKTALRSLIRHKNYAVVNIAGLAVGIAVCLVIFIVIQFQMSYDNFHTKKDRIYRVLTEYHHADATDVFYGRAVPAGVPASLETSFPQIEKVARVYSEGNDQLLVLNDNGQVVKKFKEQQGVFFLQPAFFDIFDFKWLAGNAASLKDPNSAVLTKEIAEKYFGDWKTAVGRTLKWNNSAVLKVTGVLGTIPSNTDIPLKVVISLGTGRSNYALRSTEWNNTGSDFGCYVLFANGISETSANEQFRVMAKKMKTPDNKDSQVFQLLSKQHYDTQAGNFGGKTISKELIRALWIIAGFILLIACVNFINLSTAQAVNRAKEVSVRKVLGSNRWQLKAQFLTETLLIVLTAVILSLLVTVISLPAIGRVLDIPLSIAVLTSTSVLFFLLIIIVSVTTLAGFYPSVVLSRFNPVNALKSRLAATNNKGISLRRGLVVFQFVIAQALIIGTLIIVMQMNYFTSRPLGFDKDAVINVPFPGDSAGTSKLNLLRNELTGIKGVRHVSFSSNTPVEDNNDNWTKFRFDHAAKETDFYAINKFSDDSYLPTYQLPLVAGRNLSASDTVKEFLVNETLVKKLGITSPQNVLNKDIRFWDDRMKGNIVGVVKDFHNRSFRAEYAPLLISSMKDYYSEAAIKVAPENALPAVKAMEKIWGNVYPDFVFEYQFLDDKIESFYKEEQRLSYLYKIFAAIAIFLSCLGLYGLASFMAVQRIKEVGVRKVLGASAGNIVYLFSKEFIILIAIAFVIATPIAWYFMNKWLEDYIYRINISWWIFAVGGIASILVALTTVGFQAIKAAIANPVKSLRTE